MAKILVENLTGRPLDWAVELVMGGPIVDVDRWLLNGRPYSTDESAGGYQILEQKKIAIEYDEFRIESTDRDSDAARWLYKANCGADVFSSMFGLTHLEAGLRCLVAHELGLEIDVPDAVLDPIASLAKILAPALNDSEAAPRSFYVQTILKDPGMVGVLLGGYASSHEIATDGSESIQDYIERCAEQDFENGIDGCLFPVAFNAALRKSGPLLSKVDVPNDVLCHAGYLWAEYMKVNAGEEVELHDGEINAAMYVTNFANVIAKSLTVADQLGFENPGLFDYEVTPQMSQWLHRNPNASDEAFFKALLPCLERFFERDCQQIAQIMLPGPTRKDVVSIPHRVARDDSPSP